MLYNCTGVGFVMLCLCVVLCLGVMLGLCYLGYQYNVVIKFKTVLWACFKKKRFYVAVFGKLIKTNFSFSHRCWVFRQLCLLNEQAVQNAFHRYHLNRQYITTLFVCIYTECPRWVMISTE